MEPFKIHQTTGWFCLLLGIADNQSGQSCIDGDCTFFCGQACSSLLKPKKHHRNEHVHNGGQKSSEFVLINGFKTTSTVNQALARSVMLWSSRQPVVKPLKKPGHFRPN